MNAPGEPDGIERGSMTVELVVLVPVLVLFTLVAVGLGRYEGARQEVVDAAHAGAEAASLVPSAGQAGSVAQATALSELRGQPHMCPDPVVTTDVSAFVAGGSVRVSISCRVNLADLLVPGFPGGATVVATQSAPIDPYRVVQ